MAFAGSVVRKSAAVRHGTGAVPLSLVTVQRTSAGATGRPSKLPGTRIGGVSNASTAISTRPQRPSGVCTNPVWLRMSASRIVGRVWSAYGARCPFCNGLTACDPLISVRCT